VVRFTALHFAYLQSRPVEKFFLLVRVLTKCSCLGKQLNSMAALALVRVFTNKFCSCLEITQQHGSRYSLWKTALFQLVLAFCV
ncbi:MAG: hypothetical protein NZM34_13880, partial [Bernardetiaceae bacterium]|nr:hypothetical protein [Bernardetiaceae bacterium]